MIDILNLHFLTDQETCGKWLTPQSRNCVNKPPLAKRLTLSWGTRPKLKDSPQTKGLVLQINSRHQLRDSPKHGGVPHRWKTLWKHFNLNKALVLEGLSSVYICEYPEQGCSRPVVVSHMVHKDIVLALDTNNMCNVIRQKIMESTTTSLKIWWKTTSRNHEGVVATPKGYLNPKLKRPI